MPAPFSGQGLTPILQDPALAAHPPLLYAGYVGFSMSFAFAIAALAGNEKGRDWARWMRPWILSAWIFLTLGIALGSYWAYYELGWGGFWFWDPVENASLMPWLAGTALLHSALVAETRDTLKRWVLLLAIVTFALSLSGTFLVRSGVLTSVHAFANDPQRGIFILAILAGFTGGGLALYAHRLPFMQADEPFQPVSREGALLANNVFSGHGHGDGFHRHNIPSGTGCGGRRQDFRRCALFQCRLCTAHPAFCPAGAVRPAFDMAHRPFGPFEKPLAYRAVRGRFIDADCGLNARRGVNDGRGFVCGGLLAGRRRGD